MQLEVDKIQELIIAYGLKYGVKIVIALAIFIIGKWLASKATHFIQAVMRKSRMEETLIRFFGNIINGAILAFVVIASLNQLGVNTTSLAAVIAAAGLAVGLALQGSLSNLAAGVMLIVFRPFKVGDFINAGGAEGKVEEISIFTTNMTTIDNKHVIVPNNEITGGVITNFSAKETRRIDLIIGVSYDDDLAKTKTVLADVIDNEPRILKDPAPTIGVLELADSSINFAVRPWVNTSDFWPTRFDLLQAIKERLDAEGISIPFPQRDVHMIESANDDAKPAPKSSGKKKSA